MTFESNDETTENDAAEAPAEDARAQEATDEVAAEPNADEETTSAGDADAAADAEDAPEGEAAPEAEAEAAPVGAEAEEDAAEPDEEAAPPREPGLPPQPPRSVEDRVAERTERRQKTARSRRAYRLKQRERRRQAGPAPVAEQAPAEHGPGRPRVRQGIVVSDKADKTLVVRIDVTRQHRVYKKTIRESSTLHAHDERNEANEGDTVRVVESRPLSRTKRWRLIEVIERAR